jgi:hypothetical protein
MRRGKNSEPELETSELIDGRYQLLGPLGKGGMGVVYRALQRPIGREVAVKLLRRSDAASDPERAAKRFLREARAIAELHHPHIVPLFDFGESARGDRFLVMELLPGESLAKLLRREGRLTVARAAAILDQVLDALAEAHAQGIVHRDLKPENIQIGRRGERTDFVTVMDFGISRQTEDMSATRSTIEIAGTPEYMAPEQIVGAAVDTRTDLYAAGVLLFEMVTGDVPFSSEKTFDIYNSHLRAAVPRLRERGGPELPGLQDLLDRALAKDASQRLASATAFRRALAAVVSSSPGPALNPASGAMRLTPVPRPGRAAAPPVRHRSEPEPDAALLASGAYLALRLEPARGGGADALLDAWALDIAERGGVLESRDDGVLVASFAGDDAPVAALDTALAVRQRLKTTRQQSKRPLYVHAGIHATAPVAMRLCTEAPRDGVFVYTHCAERLETSGLESAARARAGEVRLEPAGEVRMRGYRAPIVMMQVVAR